MEIQIGRRSLQIAAGIALAFVSVVAALAVFGLVGAAVTPYDAEGRPVVLKPELIAAESYRARVVSWTGAMRALQADLFTLLETGGSDLYGDSAAANDAHTRARAVAEAIEVAPAPPPAMAGLWEQARFTAGIFLDAAQWTASWVGAPTPDLKNEAVAALEAAGAALDELEMSPWLNREVGETHQMGDPQWNN